MDQYNVQANETARDPNAVTGSRLSEDYYLMQGELARVAGELMQARKARVGELLEKERLSERLSQLLEVLPGAVVVLDADGILVECNQFARQVFGRPLCGQTWAELIARVRAFASTGDGVIRLADGRSLSLARQSLASDGGEILLLMDISETERLQAVVQQHKRLSELGEMSARLAHQVRTPLAAATLYLSRLDTDIETDPERTRDYIRRTLGRLRDLESLVSDMLVYASGAQEKTAEVDIAEVAVRAVQALSPLLGAEHEIEFDIDDGDLSVAGHAATLQAAIGNLVTNAVQFNTEGGPISVTVRNRGDEVAVSVRDNGPGIPVEFHDRVFEPFFSTRSQGTGLGLAVVRTVAETHGGRVTIEDNPDGAEFTVALPRSCQPSVMGA